MQKHLMVQQPDGWFWRELHGVDGMDCHIRGLLKLGVEAAQPCIQKAAAALMTPETAGQHNNWFRGGEGRSANTNFCLPRFLTAFYVLKNKGLLPGCLLPGNLFGSQSELIY